MGDKRIIYFNRYTQQYVVLREKPPQDKIPQDWQRAWPKMAQLIRAFSWKEITPQAAGFVDCK